MDQRLNELKHEKQELLKQCKVAENENDMRELYRLTKEVFVLEREEVKILKGLKSDKV